MKSLNVLDVTLRDGGCVNNFNFGQDYMEKILSAQEAAGINVIELGYIDNKNGTASGRTQYINTEVIPQCVLRDKKSDTSYVVMMDYGKYDVNDLPQRTQQGIDGIRVAFHKKNRLDVIPLGKQIMEKGYDLYIQPMLTLSYSDSELLELIDLVNQELSGATAFYIVDSFGEMRPNDMSRVLNLVDHNLNGNMALGFHSHNNLQLSYSNAISFLQFPTNRNIMLDCSIMGMGKGAGNLNTELLLEHLNLFYGKDYKIAPLLEVIDKVINQLRTEHYWGYAPEYYLSSANHCTPSYASHFYNKHMLPIDQVGELLSMIAPEKKISFDKTYAENLYRKYNEEKCIDDTADVAALKEIFSGKEVLLVAPGKSILTARDSIQNVLTQKDVISLGLNMVTDLPLDFFFATKQEPYEEVVASGKNIITLSRVFSGKRDGVYVLNYKDWINVDGQTQDASIVIMFNLLKACQVKTILLAGFDGFSSDINENYFDPNLRRPISPEQAEEKNSYTRGLIQKMRNDGMQIQFLTSSKYDG